jgi:hypothetical protein
MTYSRNVVGLAKHLLAMSHHAVELFGADSHAVSQSCLKLSCFLDSRVVTCHSQHEH